MAITVALYSNDVPRFPARRDMERNFSVQLLVSRQLLRGSVQVGILAGIDDEILAKNSSPFFSFLKSISIVEEDQDKSQVS